METFRVVFDTVFRLLNTRFYFPPFTITPLNFFIALSVLSLLVWAVREIFER